MCGIMGYTGTREAVPVLLEGLRRLEYRGYDSAGLATLAGASLCIRKRVGRVNDLAALLEREPAPGTCGIAHTRWATHGRVTEANAHPHVDGNNLIAVAHNGVIENYVTLRSALEAKGVAFQSQTDTEALAHLIAFHYEGDLLEAVQRALECVVGTYGLAVVSPRHPGVIVGARLGSPQVVGVGRGENFLASDPGALAGYSDQIVLLEDYQVCMLTAEGWSVRDRSRAQVAATAQPLNTAVTAPDRGPFEHFMLKEIYEQPQALEDALRGRLDETESTAKFGGLNLDATYLHSLDRIVMVAAGTSYHAALVGEYMIEEMARIPVEVEYASEFRYRAAPLSPRTLIIVLSQSGETADTLFAMREARRLGLRTLGLCNVVGSSIARGVDGGIYLHAGPEIGVASTKAFLNQLVILELLALYLGRMRRVSALEGARILRVFRAAPDLLRRALQCHDAVRAVAERYVEAADFLYLGRLSLFPIALEGALKLKEVSYIHAEGYPAGEMKHGPLALVSPQVPTVVLAPRCRVHDKVMSNLEEVRARGGPIIAVATEGDSEVAARAESTLFIPPADDLLQPLLATVPLQLLAYELGRLRGCDVDRPRNLAKSVTVE